MSFNSVAEYKAYMIQRGEALGGKERFNAILDACRRDEVFGLQKVSDEADLRVVNGVVPASETDRLAARRRLGARRGPR